MSGQPLVAPELADVPGWYGKIPCLGDFASRRLPERFIVEWDRWLQHSITASRAILGPDWLDTYLTSPIWRFVLLPGVIGESVWAGMMMPSVDKVGRHFPLTIAIPLAPRPAILATVIGAQDWFAALEEASLATLNIEFSVQQYELRLAATPFLSERHGEQYTQAMDLAGCWQEPSAGFDIELSAGSAMQDIMSAAAIQLLQSTGFGKSIWWYEIEALGCARLCCFNALPPPEFYSTLLQGQRALKTS